MPSYAPTRPSISTVTNWKQAVETIADLPALGVPGDAILVMDDGDNKTALYAWNENILSWEKIADPDFASGGGDGRVHVSSNDLSLGYLLEKLETASDAVTITEINNGGAEKVSIDVDFQRIELEKQFKIAFNTSYAELTYTGDQLTAVDIWEDDTKALKLFSKSLTYSGDTLIAIETTDEQTFAVLNVTLTYSGDSLSTVTKQLN